MPKFLADFLAGLTDEQAKELLDWLDEHRNIDMCSQIESHTIGNRSSIK